MTADQESVEGSALGAEAALWHACQHDLQAQHCLLEDADLAGMQASLPSVLHGQAELGLALGVVGIEPGRQSPGQSGGRGARQQWQR